MSNALLNRRTALIAAAVFATLLVAVATWQLRGIVLLFIVSLAVAAMIRAPIDFLASRKVPRGLATLLVILTGISVLVGTVIAVGPVLIAQWPSLLRDASDAYWQLRGNLMTGHMLGQFIARLLPSAAALERLGAGPANVSVDAALVATMSLLEAFTQSIVVIVLALYWSSDRLSFERLWLSLLAPEQRMRARNAWRAIEDEVGAYLRSEAVQTLLTGVLLYVGFALLGINYPVLLATIAALVWLVPIVGALIALPLIALIAGLSGSVAAVSAFVLTLLVYVLMEFLVEPRLYRRRRFNTIWTVLAALALLDAIGLVGLFVAPILATTVQIVVEEWQKPASSPLAPSTAAATTIDFGALRMRVAGAREALGKLEQPPPHAVGLLSRLEALLERTAQEA